MREKLLGALLGGLLALVLALGCSIAQKPPAATTPAATASSVPAAEPRSSAPASLAGPGPTTSAAPADGYVIDPAALVGCRAPDELSCAQCCDVSEGGCELLSGDEDFGQFADVKPWYNSRSAKCPQQCAKCAACTKRSEQELRSMLPFRCDCEHTEIGIDPCMAPGSCGCECRRRAYLSKACPAAPKR